MKKSLLTLLALVAVAAHADPIANMVAQCHCVMDGGVCQVTNNPRPPKPGEKIHTSAGDIDAVAYNAIRQKGPLMCEAGKKACTASWNGDQCRAFRLMFRQDPLVCVRPGEVRLLKK